MFEKNRSLLRMGAWLLSDYYIYVSPKLRRRLNVNTDDKYPKVFYNKESES